jgi:acylphosphatase
MGVGVSTKTRSVLVRISGRVQHVGFRWFVERRASELGLRGWVRNSADGCVELAAEGEADRVEQLLAALRRGPSQAIVQSVEIEERSAPTGAVNTIFEILP